MSLGIAAIPSVTVTLSRFEVISPSALQAAANEEGVSLLQSAILNILAQLRQHQSPEHDGSHWRDPSGLKGATEREKKQDAYALNRTPSGARESRCFSGTASPCRVELDAFIVM
eukprot:7223858-Prymnesium_polylepis.1